MSTYYERAIDERLIFSVVKPRLFDAKKFDIQCYTSPADGKEVFDFAIQIFKKPDENRDTGLVASLLVESKVRTHHYDTLMLEKTKYTNLVKSASMNGATILYCVTTPVATYIFNLSEMDNLKFTTEEHNKSSVYVDEGKKLKKVTYLPIELAVNVYPVKTTDLPLLRFMKTQAVEKTIEKSKRKKIMNDLFIGL